MNMTPGQVVASGLFLILAILIGLWALKYILWIGIGIVIGAFGHAIYVRASPYWTQMKVRL